MRLLIVDDEILVRIGLKTMIPMAEEQFEIIGEASNGLEAISILEQMPCDIVLTDIRMPKMDGLELLGQIHSRWPEIKSLILSNHNDFQYVQTALRHGAVEYIMKLEMEPAELLEKLNMIKTKILEERLKNAKVSQLEHKVRQYGREVKEKRLRELLQQHWTPGEMEELFREFPFLPPGTHYSVAVIQIGNYHRILEQNRFQSDRLLTFTVANVLTEICKKYGRFELAELEQGRFAVVTPDLQISMLEEMRKAVHTFLKLELSMGVSLRKISRLDIQKAYLESGEALEFRFYRGLGEIDFYGNLPTNLMDLIKPVDAGPWQARIEQFDEKGLRQMLSDWVSQSAVPPRYTPDALREQWVRLADIFAGSLEGEGVDINAVTQYEEKYPHHVIRSAETLWEIHDWFDGWIPVFLDYRRKHGKQKWRKEIQTVIRLINERLRAQLKVQDLAEEVGFTENYLSVLFRKETGETLTDYITRLRMKQARELLKDPELKIYTVSEQVGYTDPNHFSRSFKQLEGMYPTEYRKLILGKG